jgi:prepilin-type N-terminal cleavage/methylation domain-containing protein
VNEFSSVSNKSGAKHVRKDSGLSLLEILVTVAVVLIIAAVGTPILLLALQAVRGLIALVNQVVID